MLRTQVRGLLSKATRCQRFSSSLPTALSQLGYRQFNDKELASRVDDNVFQAFKAAQATGAQLSKDQKNSIATAVSDWALERGACTFTHWFSPVRQGNGAFDVVNGEKLDSFIDMDFSTGEVVAPGFSGTKLFNGETDGSSFPNGGLRATHTAAAYTGWDITSPPFVRGDTLYVPATFVSWYGHALDNKTPLLRSQEAINRQGTRFAKHFGFDFDGVTSTVGWEQEFFVIDRKHYLKRPDLGAAGRTLLGASPARGQQTDANYFGRIPPRVRAMLRDFEYEAWELGIPNNTYHNEVAPGQHEISPIFSTTNVAADQNTLAMEVLHETAAQHGLAVLMHEKPFAGLNGSGKHNNWGVNASSGDNFCHPGKTPEEQARFVAFCAALARTLDVHGDVLRIGTATAGNDHRLGAQEAPPAIISLYLGEDLTAHLEKVIDGGELAGFTIGGDPIDVGTNSVQHIEKRGEDRNRTAPFPFCGNRFEFRAVGSQADIQFPLACLNTAFADSLSVLSDAIEGGQSPRDAVADMLKKHKHAIFNGNGYSDEWPEEAAKRGLRNARTTPEALAEVTSAKNIELFASQNVLSPAEMEARRETYEEKYAAQLQLEGASLLEMLNSGVIPAGLRDLAETGTPTHAATQKYVQRKDDGVGAVVVGAEDLQRALDGFPEDAGSAEQAVYARDSIKPAMESARAASDALEGLVAGKHWPYPTYQEMLYDHLVQDGDEYFSPDSAEQDA